MTAEEAEQILGPELSAEIRAQAAAAPPLSDEKIALLAQLLDLNVDTDAA